MSYIDSISGCCKKRQVFTRVHVYTQRVRIHIYTRPCVHTHAYATATRQGEGKLEV